MVIDLNFFHHDYLSKIELDSVDMFVRFLALGVHASDDPVNLSDSRRKPRMRTEREAGTKNIKFETN